MLATAAAGVFTAPHLDYTALAPEIVLTVTIVVAMIADLMVDERQKGWVSRICGVGLLASLLPIAYMGSHGITGAPRSMFGGAYVVDTFSLVLKGLLLISGFVVLLISLDYISEGDYYEGEYAYLVLSSLLGMLVMASARDLITIFVALELLSIPGYMLAGWRKSDSKSNEAALKYYLLGVLASGVMLYGMSIIYGWTGTTVLADMAPRLAGSAGKAPIVALAIFFVICGFAFKVSAVPFHLWAPDTYQGAPTPVTAFLSVASKTAGFLALMQLTFVGFLGRDDIWKPVFWALAALTMTIGNLTALRQTNIVRMLAFSSVAQAGYILIPFAVARPDARGVGSAIQAIVVYLLSYAAMNLGAFAVVIAVSRRTKSGEISSWGGLFTYSPLLSSVMAIFLISLAGIPPMVGWYGKFEIIRSIFAGGPTGAGVVLGVILAVNSVVAFAYYGNVARVMFFTPVPEGTDTSELSVPPALQAAVGLTGFATVGMGIVPGFLSNLGKLSNLIH